MNIDTINNFGLFVLLIIELFLMFKILRYWLQIISVLNDEKSSMYSQKDLNDAAMRGRFKEGYGIIFSNMAESAKILLSTKNDNPRLISLVKGIRRSIFFFFVTPLFLAFVLIFVGALMQ